MGLGSKTIAELEPIMTEPAERLWFGIYDIVAALAGISRRRRGPSTRLHWHLTMPNSSASAPTASWFTPCFAATGPR